jgi:hypothetical protein
MTAAKAIRSMTSAPVGANIGCSLDTGKWQLREYRARQIACSWMSNGRVRRRAIKSTFLIEALPAQRSSAKQSPEIPPYGSTDLSVAGLGSGCSPL